MRSSWCEVEIDEHVSHDPHRPKSHGSALGWVVEGVLRAASLDWWSRWIA